MDQDYQKVTILQKEGLRLGGALGKHRVGARESKFWPSRIAGGLGRWVRTAPLLRIEGG